MTAASLAIPARLEDVSAAWLTGALQGRLPGAVVEAVAVDGATDGTTTRARLRLAGYGPVPPALFVKLAPRDRPTRAFVGALDVVGDLLAEKFVLDVGEDHPHPLLDEQPDGGRSDPACAAGDDRYFALQVGHGKFSF